MRPDVEQWAPIDGWPGYEVSTAGRVRSVTRRLTRRNGQAFTVAGRILRPVRKNGRHLAVSLRDETNGRSSRPYIHRLVAKAFIPNPEEFDVVRHLDDNADDNSVENLCWGTHGDNAWDRVRNGRHHNALKTHCPSGHPYSGENLVIGRRGDGSTFRACRACSTRRSSQSAAPPLIQKEAS